MGGVPPLRVCVVGAGPAGLMAAGQAAAPGTRVVLLEGGDRPGRKLLLTGKGRCNLTNTLPAEEFLAGFGANGAFLRNGLHRFFSAQLREFLAGIGVETAIERGGRVYPARGGAAAVLEALLGWCRARGVRLLTGHRVTTVARDPGDALLASGAGFAEAADRIVLAVGGASYPQTGSRGDGYRVAAALGHRVVDPRPALVPVRCRESLCRRLAGLRLRNVGLRATPPGAPPIEAFGEVHVTPFGISGPAVFPASRRIGELAARAPVPLQINLKPGLDEKRLEARLERELAPAAHRTLSAAIATLLPRQMVPVFLDVAGLQGGALPSRLDARARHTLLQLLRAFPLTAIGTLPVGKGMVTAGGVDLRQVHPVTMASRLVPGLFFAGELLDLDGDTGGYNLQAAFTTGFLAGRAAGAP